MIVFEFYGVNCVVRRAEERYAVVPACGLDGLAPRPWHPARVYAWIVLPEFWNVGIRRPELHQMGMNRQSLCDGIGINIDHIGQSFQANVRVRHDLIAVQVLLVGRFNPDRLREAEFLLQAGSESIAIQEVVQFE